MLDLPSCQICYPLEIKLLLLVVLVLHSESVRIYIHLKTFSQCRTMPIK